MRVEQENQEILFAHLNDQIIANARLVKENDQLKEDLCKRSEPEALPSEDATVNAAAVAEQQLRDLTERYAELSKKFNDVSLKAKYLEKKNASVMQKNKDMKESVRAWQEYADRQSGKQKLRNEQRAEDGRLRLLVEDRPHMPSSPRSVATVRTPHLLADLERSSPAPVTPLPEPVTENLARPSTPGSMYDGEAGRSSTSVTPRPSVLVGPGDQRSLGADGFEQASSPPRGNAMRNDERLALSYSRPGNPSSSQTTVDELTEPTNTHALAVDTEDDNDFPQFVSERNLKRKRDQRSKSRFEIYADRSSDGTPVKPFRVKEEQYSSPPIPNSKLARTETFDLDDPAPNVLQTPHHPKRTPTSHLNSSETLRHQRSNSAPFTQVIKSENTDIALPDIHIGLGNPQVAAAETRALSEPSEPNHNVETALRPLDPNVTSSASEGPPNKRLRRAAVQRKEGHGMLAESGENTPPVDEDELRLPPHLARAQLNRRLFDPKSPRSLVRSAHHTPKAGPTKVKVEQLETPPATVSRSTHPPFGSARPHSRTSKSHSKPREDPVPGDGPVWTMKAPEPRPSAQKTRVSPPKRQGRLKDRPWTGLTLQDFKPNPSYNQGYTYAFSETVRKRADRLCLPGCTNTQCCGSTFRTFAEAQVPLPASQEEALLEDYLGDAYHNMPLTQMSSEERKELVLQARTKKMAKESGKHREAYERRRTPPGFWRVDFPTTQEHQEDRERAKEQERAEVQQRWLEAQRKGGKWIFRDE